MNARTLLLAVPIAALALAGCGKEDADKAKSAVSSAAKSATDAAKSAGAAATDALAAIKEQAGKYSGQLEGVTKKFTDLKAMAEKAGAAVPAEVKTMIDSIGPKIESLKGEVTKMTGMTGGDWKAVSDKIGAGFSEVEKMISDAMSKLSAAKPAAPATPGH